jgi:hypothetical protein
MNAIVLVCVAQVLQGQCVDEFADDADGTFVGDVGTVGFLSRKGGHDGMCIGDARPNKNVVVKSRQFEVGRRVPMP